MLHAWAMRCSSVLSDTANQHTSSTRSNAEATAVPADNDGPLVVPGFRRAGQRPQRRRCGIRRHVACKDVIVHEGTDRAVQDQDDRAMI